MLNVVVIAGLKRVVINNAAVEYHPKVCCVATDYYDLIEQIKQWLGLDYEIKLQALLGSNEITIVCYTDEAIVHSVTDRMVKKGEKILFHLYKMFDGDK